MVGGCRRVRSGVANAGSTRSNSTKEISAQQVPVDYPGFELDQSPSHTQKTREIAGLPQTSLHPERRDVDAE